MGAGAAALLKISKQSHWIETEITHEDWLEGWGAAAEDEGTGAEVSTGGCSGSVGLVSSAGVETDGAGADSSAGTEAEGIGADEGRAGAEDEGAGADEGRAGADEEATGADDEGAGAGAPPPAPSKTGGPGATNVDWSLPSYRFQVWKSGLVL